MWVSHARSLGILSFPCGTFLLMMKCYCSQCQTFSLYQSHSWQSLLFRQTWDNFKVRIFNTWSSGQNFFPSTAQPFSFSFIMTQRLISFSWGLQWRSIMVTLFYWDLRTICIIEIHSFFSKEKLSPYRLVHIVIHTIPVEAVLCIKTLVCVRTGIIYWGIWTTWSLGQNLHIRNASNATTFLAVLLWDLNEIKI